MKNESERLSLLLEQNIRGEACAGPGKERERCICIMAPSGAGLAAISSLRSLEMPVNNGEKGARNKTVK